MKMLKNRKGESFAETIISVLIAALATLIFVSMIIAGRRSSYKSEETLTDFYNAETGIETILTGGTTPDGVQVVPSSFVITRTNGETTSDSVKVYSDGEYNVLGFMRDADE